MTDPPSADPSPDPSPAAPSRPTFDRDDDLEPGSPVDDSGDERPVGPILAWLRLLRAPNVFTAIADTIAGSLFVAGVAAYGGLGVSTALLVLSTAALYLAGMVLNDLADVEIDRKERPFRPLPSGAIGVSAAATVGWGLLIVGIVLATSAGFVARFDGAVAWRPAAVGVLLAAAIVGYNFGLKATALGPLAMGSCRTLNWLLAMSVAANAERALDVPTIAGWTLPASFLSFPLDCWLVALSAGVYVAGVTCFARGEAAESPRGPLLLGIGLMIAGFAGLALLGAIRPLPPVLKNYLPLLLLLIGAPLLLRAIQAATDPEPYLVQGTVKSALMTLIALAAIVALIGGGPYAGAAVFALVVPMLALGRWVYST